MICFAWLRPPPPFFLGGAEISQNVLAEGLTKNGISVQYFGIYSHPFDDSVSRLSAYLTRLEFESIKYELDNGSCRYTYRGISVHLCHHQKFFTEVTNFIRNSAPKYFITSHEKSDEIADLARRSDVSLVTWIHSVSREGCASLRTQLSKVLVVSEFVQSFVRANFGIDSTVLYPPFEKTLIANPSLDRSYILFVNPIPRKGLDIFCSLPSAFPQEQFLAMCSWDQVPPVDALSFANVRVLPMQDDVVQIYHGAKLLLAPSQYGETFGRVVVEAAIAGVPSISSNIPGLLEAQGVPQLSLSPNNEQIWRNTLGLLLADRKLYLKYAKQSQIAAIRFLNRDIVAEFLRALQ